MPIACRSPWSPATSGGMWARTGASAVFTSRGRPGALRVAEAVLAAGRVTPAFAALMEFEIERTEAYYRHARHRRAAAGYWPLGRDGWAGGLPRHPRRHPPQRLRCLHPARQHNQAAESLAGLAGAMADAVGTALVHLLQEISKRGQILRDACDRRSQLFDQHADLFPFEL